MTHAVHEQHLKIPADGLASALANPLCAPRATPAPATTTLGSRAVYHEAHAAFRPLLARVQTREQLSALIGSLDTIACQEAAINPPPPFHDPSPVQKKGCPSTARITAAREGHGRGARTRGQAPSERYLAAISAEQQGSSSPSRAPSPPAVQVPKGRKCGLCGRTGHNRLTCPGTHAA
ncbi:hypothetical protein AURDEDRAFT_76002 [Auricularia subglabra TFB-10046 SS5]|nr:hypothetical protein AURDEDRAFT_76002 [Auricularia subglabra TFB-10046 SS5]